MNSHTCPSPSIVVGIGASAGGLKPLEQLFAGMPQKTGLVFIVVQHLSPDYKSIMNDLLARQTQIPVRIIEPGTPIEPDHIFLPPPGTTLRIEGSFFHLEALPRETGGSTRIDHFFEHLAETTGELAVAIILSGSGSDGARGISAIHEAGGLVICQTPDSAQFSSMPQSALASGCVDLVLDPEAIPLALIEALDKRPPNTASPACQPEIETTLQELFNALQNKFGIDFAKYKENTIRRRILRRARLHGETEPADYLKSILQNPTEWDRLYQDFLIGVTEFFRDPDAFTAIQEHIAEVVARKPDGEDLRIWIAGCATGPEAYSIAILAHEAQLKLSPKSNLVIYATDAHRGSLEKASTGVFDAPQLQHLSPDRRQKYFVELPDGRLRICPSLRQRIVFAPHNLLSDPPFTRLDLISCRNVLIYFRIAAQEQVLQTFHYALRTNGLLFLGASEGLSQLASSFKTMDKKHKIFRKVGLSGNMPSPTNEHLRNILLPHPNLNTSPLPPREARIDRSLLNAYDFLLEKFAPAGFLLQPDGEILHIFGNTERLLGFPSGRPDNNLLQRASGPLKIALLTLFTRLREGERSVQLSDVPNGPQLPSIDLQATRIDDRLSGKSLFHLTFSEHRSHTHALTNDQVPSPATQTLSIPPHSQPDSFQQQLASLKLVEELQNELASNRETLQATIEELQTANEELQTSNEEMLASNEELQSTNEELQSVNEELYSVNAEYQEKIDQLNTLNAEHNGILESVDIGILFVDRNKRIRRFNRAIENILRLLPHDLGRPLDHLAPFIDKPDNLLRCVDQVLIQGHSHENEVRTRNGTFYHMRIFPLTSIKEQIDGAVLTFADLTESRRAAQALRTNEERLRLAIQSTRQGLWEAQPLEETVHFSDTLHDILAYPKGALKPAPSTWSQILAPNEVQRWQQFFTPSLLHDQPFAADFRVRLGDNSLRWMRLSGKVIARDPDGSASQVIGLLADIDEEKKLQLNMAETEQRLAISMRTANQVWWDWRIPRHKLIIHGFDSCILGYDDCLGEDRTDDFWWSRIPDDELTAVKASLQRHFDGKDEVWHCEHRYRDSQDQPRWVVESGQVVERSPDGKPVRMIGVTQLNDDRKRAEIALRESEILYQSIVEDQEELICRFATNLRLTFVNRAFSSFYGRPRKELLGSLRTNWMPDNESEGWRLHLASLTCANPASRYEQQIKSPDGSLRWLQWTDRAFYSNNGQCLGFQSVGRDITAIKNSNARLESLLYEANQARLEAEKANRAKSEFLAVMNHELRTPLNPIIAGSELLTQLVQHPEHLELIQTIHGAGNHLLGLINSVLDLSKLQADKWTPVYKPVRIGQIIQQTANIFRESAQSKKLHFHVQVEPNLPWIISDADMIRQVIINLIGNALKFTRKGSVSLNATMTCNDKINGTLHIAISDTGIGMDAQTQQLIFQAFVQGDSGIRRQYGGTGIGLTISKHLVELLGGSIKLQSEPSQGSSFTVILPVAIVSPDDVPTEENTSLQSIDYNTSNANVLIVDDDTWNRHVLQTMLKNQVKRVECAIDGFDALHQIRKEEYHLVIMDVHMHHLNGFETSKAIYDEPLTYPSPHIIFLTADTREETLLKAAHTHGHSLLHKPVTRETLLQAISKALHESEATLSTAPQD